MSPDLPRRGASVSAAFTRPERRLHSRYPVRLKVYYQSFRDQEAVRADHILPTGLDVELFIDWPSGVTGDSHLGTSNLRKSGAEFGLRECSRDYLFGMHRPMFAPTHPVRNRSGS
jgi:hypothetical protein